MRKYRALLWEIPKGNLLQKELVPRASCLVPRKLHVLSHVM